MMPCPEQLPSALECDVRPGAVDAYLRRRAPGLLPGNPPVQEIVPLGPDVWEVSLEGRQKLVAKHQLLGFFTRGKKYDLLAVEQRVLGLLGSQGCPVPRILDLDLDAHFVFFEYCGSCTLDDLAQETAGSATTAYAGKAVEGLCQIEQTCAENQHILQPLVAPAADIQQLQNTWNQAGKQAFQGLEHLLIFCQISSVPAAARGRALLHEMLSGLASRNPSLGSMDYNARNLVIDPPSGRLSFIEFAKMGWDWTERRLVQYTTSMGAGRPQGCFQSLLNEEIVRQYARAGQNISGRSQALDSHHILLHLNAAALLCTALEKSEQRRHARLLQAWHNPHQRLRQLVRNLALKLSDAPLTSEFRDLFHHSVHSIQERHA